MTTDLNTTFRHCPFLFAAQPPPACLLPSQQIPDSKKHPGNAFCLYLNAGGTRNRRRCGQMYRSTNVFGCRRCSASQGAGKRGKHGFPGYFFVCLTCSALDRWGKKTDISVPCPMSRSAKQDLPFVRLLSVVFLSANEFWKSENSREKVHTRCALGFISVLYTFFMKIASHVSQVTHKKWWIAKINQAMIAYI